MRRAAARWLHPAAPGMRQLAVAEVAEGSEPVLDVTLAKAFEDIEIRLHEGEGFGALVPALEIEQIGDTTLRLDNAPIK